MLNDPRYPGIARDYEHMHRRAARDENRWIIAVLVSASILAAACISAAVHLGDVALPELARQAVEEAAR